MSSIQIVYLGWMYGSSKGSGRSRSLKGSSIDFFVTKILFFNLFRYCSGNGKLLYSSITSFPLSSLSGNAEIKQAKLGTLLEFQNCGGSFLDTLSKTED